MKVQDYADRPECKYCDGNQGGRCRIVIDTRWGERECPFVATPDRLKRDRELLEKAKAEGRVSERYQVD